LEYGQLKRSLGRIIRARRIERGFSQESFAATIGLHRTYVGDIERGERNVSIENLVRIANGLNLSLAEIFSPHSVGSPLQRDPSKQLMGYLRVLVPGQVELLLDMARAITSPVLPQVDPNTDIVTSEFAVNFSTRLLLHHATTAETFKKKSFEYALAAASKVAGRSATLTENGTFPGADVIIDGVKFSCKTEAAAGISRSSITVSKLMEARWIRECRTGSDFLNGVLARSVEHLRRYERIVVLRAIRTSTTVVEYKLVEIPLEVLLAMSSLKPKDFSERTPNGSSRARVKYNGQDAFTLTLDGSVEKVSVSGLKSSLCRHHATWDIPVIATGGGDED
jgi:transcriptional regulator with XRE-family HTH domain